MERRRASAALLTRRNAKALRDPEDEHERYGRRYGERIAHNSASSDCQSTPSSRPSTASSRRSSFPSGSENGYSSTHTSMTSYSSDFAAEDVGFLFTSEARERREHAIRELQTERDVRDLHRYPLPISTGPRLRPEKHWPEHTRAEVSRKSAQRDDDSSTRDSRQPRPYSVDRHRLAALAALEGKNIEEYLLPLKLSDVEKAERQSDCTAGVEFAVKEIATAREVQDEIGKSATPALPTSRLRRRSGFSTPRAYVLTINALPTIPEPLTPKPEYLSARLSSGDYQVPQSRSPVQGLAIQTSGDDRNLPSMWASNSFINEQKMNVLEHGSTASSGIVNTLAVIRRSEIPSSPVIRTHADQDPREELYHSNIQFEGTNILRETGHSSEESPVDQSSVDTQQAADEADLEPQDPRASGLEKLAATFELTSAQPLDFHPSKRSMSPHLAQGIKSMRPESPDSSPALASNGARCTASTETFEKVTRPSPGHASLQSGETSFGRMVFEAIIIPLFVLLIAPFDLLAGTWLSWKSMCRNVIHLRTLEWDCSCGRKVHGRYALHETYSQSKLVNDLPNCIALSGMKGMSSALRNVWHRLQRLAGNAGASTPENTISSQVPESSRTNTSASDHGSDASSASSHSRSNSLASSQLSNYTPPTPGSSISGASSSSLQLTVNPKPAHFELCINRGKMQITLDEIHLVDGRGQRIIESDIALINAIRERYGQHCRKGLYGHLYQPADIHWVRFGVQQRGIDTGIYQSPRAIPPAVEVKEGRYHYHECPLEDMPPIAKETFFHYFRNQHDPNDATVARSIFYERMPKKLGSSIFEQCEPDKLHFGWGLHIIEGPNKPLIGWLATAIVFSSFIVSVVYDICLKNTDSGFAIGQWMLAVLATSLAALYFHLADAV